MRWSAKEVKLLQDYYPEGGYFLCKEKGLKRNRNATLKKAQSLDIRVNNGCSQRGVPRKAWDKWEIDLMKDKYKELGIEGMLPLLLHRTEGAISLKAFDLGLTHSDVMAWSADELNLLTTYYNSSGAEGCILKGLKRTKSAILHKACSLGLKIDNSLKEQLYIEGKNKKRVIEKEYRLWTDAEISVLKEVYEVEGVEGCQLRGVQRAKSCIYRKAKKLGLKRGK